MANQITETTLEMHYHKSLMDAFKARYGLGPTGTYSFYKYSPQREKFVGFDQAYVKTDLDDSVFFDEIKKAASGSNSTIKYAGYFLQFKVVEERTNKLKNIPTEISKNPPFYAAKLSTKRDVHGNLSQHELLRNIAASSSKALVYYTCPMIFDKLDLYMDSPDLKLLRMVDVRSSGSDFVDNETHHIFFKSVTSQPVWCSEPTNGTALTFEEFIAQARNSEFTQQEFAELLLKLIEENGERIGSVKEQVKLSNKLKIFADILYLIRYSE